MFSDEVLQKKFKTILPHLNERAARLYLGSEAQFLGRGGKQRVAKLAGVSRIRIDKGIAELTLGEVVEEDSSSKKIRKPGAGRKQHRESQDGLMEALEAIVNPHTRGDPMKVLLWSSKSLRKIEKALKEKGYFISYVTVGELLKSMGYSLQGNKKTDEGGSDVDRNEQFEFINKTALSFMADDAPVISVDCKKKELIGNFKNAGTDWFEQGNAPEVKVYDFIDKELGKAIPYGVYDIAKNEGWVSVGLSKDTAEFAVNSVRTWWQQMGKEQYLSAKKILVTADGGGSNSSRSRLWKKELQTLATEIGLEIHVCHFPPGTSKWNKIEHRMFSYITKNWRAKPLESLEVIVNLIANTTTQKGLTIRAEADKKVYEKGIKIDDKQLAKINLITNNFRGDWNYKIIP
ncbi:MAG TPA: ISAzo13 family transposase [Hanamia sp.]|nr:ISAzo13 family transposase [Hanamia sp.]